MTVTLEDTLNANLVIVGVELLNEPDAVERFRNEMATDLRLEAGLVANDIMAMPEPSRSLILGRDRIRLILHASRSTIAREYPDKAGLSRLAQAASRAIEFTGLGSQAPQAFGYNMELVFNQDSGQPAIQYIGNRVFGSLSIDEPGRSLIGGIGQLIFADAAGQWTIRVEPRSGDSTTSRIFLGLNLHKEETRLPDEAGILATLEEIQREAQAFMERLERAASS